MTPREAFEVLTNPPTDPALLELWQQVTGPEASGVMRELVEADEALSRRLPQLAWDSQELPSVPPVPSNTHWRALQLLNFYRDRIVGELLRKLPGRNGRRAEQIIRGMES